MNNAQIIAIIGPPSCGKTTLVNQLAKDGYQVIEEQARKEIPKWTLPDKRLDFQKFLFLKHVELEEQVTGLVFSDTARYCSVMYADLYGFDLRTEFPDKLKYHYSKVILLHPLQFVPDGVRIETNSNDIWCRLYKTYKEFGQNVICLDKMTKTQLLEKVKMLALLKR